MAYQKDLVSHKTTGNENCLHLSVYTTDIKPDKLKPVMVWIHGGAFILGSNSKDYYNPEYLLRKDVVVITVNYRLGAFGKLISNVIYIFFYGSRLFWLLDRICRQPGKIINFARTCGIRQYLKRQHFRGSSQVPAIWFS